MLKRIGRKFVQGAKAEIEENPPMIFDPERMLDLAEAVIGLGILAISIFARARSPKATTIVINNYYISK